MNDISQKWEKWFHTYVTLIAYILCNDQRIFLIFGTKVKKTIVFCSANLYCQILVTFWITWRQNFDNFFLGHTVQHYKTFIWTYCGLNWHLIHHILDPKYIMGYGATHESKVTHESIYNLLVITYRMNKYHCFLFNLQH